MQAAREETRTPTPGEEADASSFTISPTSDVYSFFIFVIPLEEAKAPGKVTWSKILAYGLVLLTLTLQTILLYAIFNQVVSGDISWRESIMGKTHFMEPPYYGEGNCNPGGSLCTKNNGTFSCSPPSVQLTGRWDELDTNGDGVWTRDEAVAARMELKCRFIVDPVEIFDVFVNFLRSRANVIWLHPDLLAGKEIRKCYFTYASGDLIMCGYRNTDMCSNLLLSGFFDMPLKYGTAPRVGTTIRSALDYCFGLLGKGGMCERTLPSTYSVWKKSSERQCLGAQYAQAVYEHPINGATKSLLTVDYEAREDYSRVDKSLLFFCYKAIIIGSFLMEMYRELRNIMRQCVWVALYPAASTLPGGAAVTMEGGEDTKELVPKIQGITDSHRAAVGLLTVARFGVVAILTIVGITFLQKDTDWINLLLNSVAMVFVAELTTSIYEQVLSPLLRDQCEGAVPMEVNVPRFTWLRDRPGAIDVIGFIILVTTLGTVMYMHYLMVGHPLSQALECACLSEGEHCSEAVRFDRDFWAHYWKDEVPAVFSEVETLRAATPGAQTLAEQAATIEMMTQTTAKPAKGKSNPDPKVDMINDGKAPTVKATSAGTSAAPDDKPSMINEPRKRRRAGMLNPAP